MNVVYDSDADAYVVVLAEAPVDRTIQLDDANLIDVDADGNPTAIEVLEPGMARIDEIAEQFGLLDQLAEIHAAIEEAVPWSVPETGSKTTTIVNAKISYTMPRRRGNLSQSRPARPAPARELTLTPS